MSWEKFEKRFRNAKMLNDCRDSDALTPMLLLFTRKQINE